MTESAATNASGSEQAADRWQSRCGELAKSLIDMSNRAASLTLSHRTHLANGTVTWELAQAKRRSEQEAHAALDKYIEHVSAPPT